MSQMKIHSMDTYTDCCFLIRNNKEVNDLMDEVHKIKDILSYMEIKLAILNEEIKERK